MKHWLSSMIALLLAGIPLHAHYIWIVPDAKNGMKVNIIFSEDLQPDENVPIERIAGTSLYCRRSGGQTSLLQSNKAAHSYIVELPGNDTTAIGGVCVYGVIQRGDQKPFLLAYYPKLVCGPLTAAEPWDKLVLEIIPRGRNKFQVVFGCKPVPDADVVVLRPTGSRRQVLKADEQGEFEVSCDAPGLYGIRTRYIEAKAGQHDGRKYEEVRHYATLVFQVSEASAPQRVTNKPPAASQKQDNEATALLREARVARALWTNFPGFAADIEINLDGKVSRGKVKVSKAGQVSFQGLDEAAESWAKGVLRSLVAHRMESGSERDTPCAFADRSKDHPLGQSITLLNDRLGSSYRIRDKQILMVNRNLRDSRFSIIVVENKTNTEGKFLPSHWVVHYWDNKTGELQTSEAHSVAWTRVGPFDLPLRGSIVSSARNELSVRTFSLSNHQLLQPSEE